jgi:alginate O-acetyltransferase complex protein AlgI
MTIVDVLILAAAAVLLRLVSMRREWCAPALLAASIVALYWLTPLSPVRNLDFWLPTLTLLLVALSWVLVTPGEQRSLKSNAAAIGILVGVVLLVALTRLVSLNGILTASRPPQFHQVALVLLLSAGLVWLAWRFAGGRAVAAGIVVLLALLVVLKLPVLAQSASAGLRLLMQQDPTKALPGDLRWLGYSYIAFRLVHTLRERQNGRLGAVGMGEFFIYMLFFPSISAGPIDRIERFLKDLRKPLSLESADFGAAGQRLVLGLFKKFAVADALGLVALNAQNAGQAQGAGWLWLLCIAYSLYIYFDFSGYTDIAIGLGRLLGVSLPENFNQPYLKPNLTQFWNNWHMTLTQWFRAYFFNPFTRYLRAPERKLSPVLVILITQVATMLLIGLWHGITWNFVIWGLWHGLGLFVQNRYSDWAKARTAWLEASPWLGRGAAFLGGLLTFVFVTLGWVWFALPTPGLSLSVLARLFGLVGS